MITFLPQSQCPAAWGAAGPGVSAEPPAHSTDPGPHPAVPFRATELS